MSCSSEIYHHGIIGMKWGVRRYQNEDGSLTANGRNRYRNIDTVRSKKTNEKLYMAEHQRCKEDTERNFDILANGKKVGNVWLEDQGENLYLNWIDIKKTERGKGYADAVMDYIVRYSDDNNYKTLTLEVPGSSPDARHIYEKHGFKASSTGQSSSDDVRDGLTKMKRAK